MSKEIVNSKKNSNVLFAQNSINNYVDSVQEELNDIEAEIKKMQVKVNKTLRSQTRVIASFRKKSPKNL